MGSERGGWHRGRHYALFSVVSFLPSSRYHRKVLNLTEQWELELLVSSLNLVLSPTPTCPISVKDSIFHPTAHVKALGLICDSFHFYSISTYSWFCLQNLSQMHLLPCPLSPPQSQLPSSTSWMSTLLTGTSLFTLPSFSLPRALIDSLLSSPEWPLQNIKQTMSLCLKLYADFLRHFK